MSLRTSLQHRSGRSPLGRRRPQEVNETPPLLPNDSQHSFSCGAFRVIKRVFKGNKARPNSSTSNYHPPQHHPHPAAPSPTEAVCNPPVSATYITDIDTPERWDRILPTQILRTMVGELRIAKRNGRRRGRGAVNDRAERTSDELGSEVERNAKEAGESKNEDSARDSTNEEEVEDDDDQDFLDAQERLGAGDEGLRTQVAVLSGEVHAQPNLWPRSSPNLDDEDASSPNSENARTPSPPALVNDSESSRSSESSTSRPRTPAAPENASTLNHGPGEEEDGPFFIDARELSEHSSSSSHSLHRLAFPSRLRRIAPRIDLRRPDISIPDETADGTSLDSQSCHSTTSSLAPAAVISTAEMVAYTHIQLTGRQLCELRGEPEMDEAQEDSLDARVEEGRESVADRWERVSGMLDEVLPCGRVQRHDSKIVGR